MQAEKFQREAIEVLEALNLLNFLSKYGRPRIVGSVALGLITWRDIDIDLEIAGGIISEDFWQTARYLLAQDKVTLISLVDNRKIIEQARPLRGYRETPKTRLQKFYMWLYFAYWLFN